MFTDVVTGPECAAGLTEDTAVNGCIIADAAGTSAVTA